LIAFDKKDRSGRYDKEFFKIKERKIVMKVVYRYYEPNHTRRNLLGKYNIII